MRLHWQNLLDDPTNPGPLWRHGRAWLHAFGLVFGWEWCFGRANCHAYVRCGRHRDRQIGWSLAFPGVALYAGIEFPFRWMRWLPNEDREVGFSIHDGSIWIDTWCDPMGGWRRSDPWWKNGLTIHVSDILLGKPRFEEEEIRRGTIPVPMPERTYEGEFIVTLAKWRRARWFTKQAARTEIKVKEGVPVPGKGENSWDCGPDATYGISTYVAAPEEAVGQLVASALESRRRHSGDYAYAKRDT